MSKKKKIILGVGIPIGVIIAILVTSFLLIDSD